MPFYMVQWRYDQASTREMVHHPVDRAKAARKAIEAAGGKLHHFFFCFGEYDGVVIAEYPDNESALANTLAIVAAGAVPTTKTTVLISAEEALRAMEHAHGAHSGFTLPRAPEAGGPGG